MQREDDGSMGGGADAHNYSARLEDHALPPKKAAVQAIEKYGVSVIEPLLVAFESGRNESSRKIIDDMTRVLEWYHSPIVGEPENAKQKLRDGINALRNIHPRAQDFGVDKDAVAALIVLVANAAELDIRTLVSDRPRSMT